MKQAGEILLAALVLIGAQLAAELIVRALSIPVPGAVVGLLLLLAVIRFTGVPEALEKLGALLLRHLNLFYVPAGVGLMAHLGLLSRDGWPIAAAIIVSTLAGILVAGWVFTRLAGGEGEDA